MPLNVFHARLANTALYYFIILAVWGYWRFIRKQGLDPSYWGALIIAEILLFLQSGVGTYLWFLGSRPDRTVHILYGIVSMMAIPAVYMYTRGREEHPEMLMYGTAILITVGLILRATFTGTFAG